MRRTEARLMTTNTLLSEEDVSMAEMAATTATANVGSAVTPQSTVSMIVPSASRTSKATTSSRLKKVHR